MIKNEVQQRVTETKLAELQATLAAYRASDADGSNRLLRQLQEDSYQSLIDELQAELVEYEEVRQGQRRRFECASLTELPQALIKVRLARGLSHKELAELCGMKEQQLQHYEETDYEGAALWRLVEVATVLCVEVRAVVTLGKFERIPSVEELSQSGTPVEEQRRTRARGMDRGLFTVPDDFNAPLPDDLLAAFEGDGESLTEGGVPENFLKGRKRSNAKY